MFKVLVVLNCMPVPICSKDYMLEILIMVSKTSNQTILETPT